MPAIAEINFKVGDVAGNCALIKEWAVVGGQWSEQATSHKPQATNHNLIIFSELAITGYPPEDLLLNKSFIKTAMKAAEELAKSTLNGPAILVGSPWEQNGKLYNAALLMEEGKIIHKFFKHDLPNYGVFDEKRWFSAGRKPEIFSFHGKKIGVLICEDLWNEETYKNLKGAEEIFVLNGSPFEVGKFEKRLEVAKKAAAITGADIYYANQIGGQDELVFDGRSFKWSAVSGQWSEQATSHKPLTTILATSIRDYAHKNGFKTATLGLSGGIDSALVAYLAAEALGPKNVYAVMLPSPFTSKESLEDAAECARNLGINYEIIPIENMFLEAKKTLGKINDITEQNLQSRLRGMLLMARSNDNGHLLLATGNKSEMATGYATLYGDMCGGFAPIKDVYKTLVYAISQEIKAIPRRIIEKKPTAELKHDQCDQDTLPPYPVLDGISENLIEEERELDEIIAQGFERETVLKVAKMLKNSEYKRRQAPPGPKITPRAFGKDWRQPIGTLPF